jgi:hypothetical protein
MTIPIRQLCGHDVGSSGSSFPEANETERTTEAESIHQSYGGCWHRWPLFEFGHTIARWHVNSIGKAA